MSLGVRHVAERRKKKIRRKGYAAHVAVLKESLDVLIYPIAVVGPLALLPQIFKLFLTQDASSLSLPTWLILALFNLAWLLYGLVHKESPIILTNIMLAMMNFAIVFGILAFR